MHALFTRELSKAGAGRGACKRGGGVRRAVLGAAGGQASARAAMQRGWFRILGWRRVAVPSGAWQGAAPCAARSAIWTVGAPRGAGSKVERGPRRGARGGAPWAYLGPRDPRRARVGARGCVVAGRAATPAREGGLGAPATGAARAAQGRSACSQG
jgi:hypothetical protein